MLLKVAIADKSIGAKHLFRDLEFVLQPKEKVGIVGRNGVGKTTLFNILSGADKNFEGEISARRGLLMVVTQQEHHDVGGQSCFEYVRDNLPEYKGLKAIVDDYPATMGSDLGKITTYTEALERFSVMNYYDIEDRIVPALGAYQITREQAMASFANLSGGQKRFVELVRVELSYADLALIDEPTNHMDYVGKAAFIDWLARTREAVAIITHDRDVLMGVDRIIEIKDHVAFSYPGNYEAYLRQNGDATMNQIRTYETAERNLQKLEAQINSARAKKAASPAYKTLEERLMREHAELKAATHKPSFWIDRDTVTNLRDDVADSYHKYKAKNIRLHSAGQTKPIGDLLVVRDLSLGYDRPLFDHLTFQLASGDRLQIKGRNGAGKTTLIKTILAVVANASPEADIIIGTITPHTKLKIGLYEQEISREYLPLTLSEAVTKAYQAKNVPVNDQIVKKVLAQYLFEPSIDAVLKVEYLSGGQKARFQMIQMLCDDPNLLILDEPTNHLDLPSIEELEKTLLGYHGAVLYVSHDSSFCNKIGGEVVEVGE